MRKPFVAGNWKMNGDAQSGVALAKGVAEGSADLAADRVCVAVIPPFVYLGAVAQAVSASGVANSPQTIAVAVTVLESPYAPADFDRDFDVDQDDFGHFQSCVTGANLGPPAPACDDADLDTDGDVDQADFGLFQRCLTGPGFTADPHCAD